MLRARWLSGSLLVALALAGCSDAVSPGSDTEQLAANREKWASHGQPVYSFTLQQNCFCAITEPVRVYVRLDTIFAAITVAHQTPVDLRYVQSVNQLFDFIDRAIANHAAVLQVTYDPTMGYPTRIVYDGSATAIDDEVTYTAKDMAPTSLPQ